jgi:hypothetical protein
MPIAGFVVPTAAFAPERHRSAATKNPKSLETTMVGRPPFRSVNEFNPLEALYDGGNRLRFSRLSLLMEHAMFLADG